MHEEPTARERARRARELERAMRELDRLDREHGLGTMPGHGSRPARARGATRRGAARSARGRNHVDRRRTALAAVATVAALLALLAAPLPQTAALRALVGLGPHRLAAAPVVPEGTGAYAFLITDHGEPVGYDPCRPVRLEVNPSGAPTGWRDLVGTAVSHVEEATGLRFVLEGTTADRDFFRRRTAVFDRPEPVLVGWADSAEEPGLGGDVAGLGGSSAGGPTPAGRRHLETGSVLLDREAFTELAARPDGRAEMQAIVDHEFGHLVGLAHVDDPRQLMYRANLGVHAFGDGDLAGLARLGSVPCG